MFFFQGGKYQEAYYIYEEIAQSPSSNTVKILNGQAVCNIHLGKHAEAEALLLEALNKVGYRKIFFFSCLEVKS